MKKFEYQITQHPSDAFKQVVVFCSETAECSIEEVPGDQTKILTDLLNERGQQGWELIQAAFGKGGVLAFWKRRIKEKEG